MNIPLPRGEAVVRQEIDVPGLPVKTALSRQAVGFRQQGLANQAFGEAGTGRVQTPNRIDIERARLIPVGRQWNKGVVCVSLTLCSAEIWMMVHFIARTKGRVLVPNIGDKLVNRKVTITEC